MMSYTSSSPSNPLADRNWRLRHSVWLLPAILCCGLLSFISFIYAAIRVRTKKFWTAALISSIGSAIAWTAVALLSETSDEVGGATATKAGEGGSWGAGIAIAIWAGLLVYGLFLNRDYLRWRAAQEGANAWYHQPAGGQASPNYGPTAPVMPQATPPQPFLGVDTSQYFAPTQTPPPTAPAPPPPRQSPPVAAPSRASTRPIDINVATPGEIAVATTLEDAAVRRIVNARIERGGFRSIDELAAAAALQPHEFVKVQGRVTFGPFIAAATPPSESTTPEPPTAPGNGRILDY
ncbi:MAG: helix-hairpin-helix domain-containing protein [Nocardioidaceae bacterium]